MIKMEFLQIYGNIDYSLLILYSSKASELLNSV